MPDFFISYNKADRGWAEWIAYVLEEEGYSTVIHAWDFRPGANFVLDMQRAADGCGRTIPVLSPGYLSSEFAQPEWAAAFAKDPHGTKRSLVPVLVRNCRPTGLLATIVRIDVVQADEIAAKRLLIEGVASGRSKPSSRPSFPGTAGHRAPASFPGPEAGARVRPAYMPKIRRAATDADKRRFAREVFEAMASRFEDSLARLAAHADSVEHDFQRRSETEFSAEVFLLGKSTCRCRIWLGAFHSADGISYAEGRIDYGSSACNEILSLSDDQGILYMTSIMGMGFESGGDGIDLKRMTGEQASDYLWRRFVAPLER